MSFFVAALGVSPPPCLMRASRFYRSTPLITFPSSPPVQLKIRFYAKTKSHEGRTRASWQESPVRMYRQLQPKVPCRKLQGVSAVIKRIYESKKLISCHHGQQSLIKMHILQQPDVPYCEALRGRGARQ